MPKFHAETMKPFRPMFWEICIYLQTQRPSQTPAWPQHLAFWRLRQMQLSIAFFKFKWVLYYEITMRCRYIDLLLAIALPRWRRLARAAPAEREVHGSVLLAHILGAASRHLKLRARKVRSSGRSTKATYCWHHFQWCWRPLLLFCALIEIELHPPQL